MRKNEITDLETNKFDEKYTYMNIYVCRCYFPMKSL